MITWSVFKVWLILKKWLWDDTGTVTYWGLTCSLNTKPRDLLECVLTYMLPVYWNKNEFTHKNITHGSAVGNYEDLNLIKQ